MVSKHRSKCLWITVSCKNFSFFFLYSDFPVFCIMVLRILIKSLNFWARGGSELYCEDAEEYQSSCILKHRPGQYEDSSSRW